MIHYKSKTHPRYPNTACGKSFTGTEHTDNIEDVTCKMCLRSYKNETPLLKSKGRYGLT